MRDALAITPLVLAIGTLTACGPTRSAATDAASTPAAQATPLVVGGATLPAGAQLDLLQNSCQACHSFGLVTQQRLSAATWKAEVVKMRGFGAPLPAANEASVVAYLAEYLGPRVPLVAPNTRVTAPPITYNEANPTAVAQGPSTGNAPPKDTGKSAAGFDYSATGAQLYTQNCAACHGAGGAGVPGAFPPLAHDPVVTAANPADHIAIILKGMQGKAIGATSYSSQMPSFSQLSNNDIAAIIDHERTSWGNHAQIVTPDQVKRAR